MRALTFFSNREVTDSFDLVLHRLKPWNARWVSQTSSALCLELAPVSTSTRLWLRSHLSQCDFFTLPVVFFLVVLKIWTSVFGFNFDWYHLSRLHCCTLLYSCLCDWSQENNIELDQSWSNIPDIIFQLLSTKPQIR